MRTRRSGSRLPRRSALAAALGLVLFGTGTAAGGADKPKQGPATYAVVAGTVFRETGMAFPGAELALTAVGDSKEARKFKEMKCVTSQRGEFLMRLPAAPMSYLLRAKAPGYRPQGKVVTVTADDRVDVFFQLERASK
ncbi:MAG: carboxypeptidase-like regulatory domain-containing protein [Bryobacteraceae bacterium]